MLELNLQNLHESVPLLLRPLRAMPLLYRYYRYDYSYYRYVFQRHVRDPIHSGANAPRHSTTRVMINDHSRLIMPLDGLSLNLKGGSSLYNNGASCSETGHGGCTGQRGKPLCSSSEDSNCVSEQLSTSSSS